MLKLKGINKPLSEAKKFIIVYGEDAPDAINRTVYYYFKEKDFKKHFCILLALELVFFVLGIIAFCVLIPMNLDKQISIIGVDSIFSRESYQ